jgi:hypothetical protein
MQVFTVDGYDILRKLYLRKENIHFRHPLFSSDSTMAVSRISNALVRLSATTLSFSPSKAPRALCIQDFGDLCDISDF